MLENCLKGFYYSIYIRIFPNYKVELKNAVKGCKTLLDVGCGSNSPIHFFSNELYSVGVDAFKPSIEESRKAKIHNSYHLLDVLKIEKKFKPNSFECVLASDVIEHLSKKDGFKLLRQMDEIASKKVILFTPNGFLSQGVYGNNPFQVHKSGWTVEEMKDLGYKVIGINGWKPLRKEFAKPRFWPRYFWWIISDITQFFVRNNPENAFQLLCIKEKTE